MYFPIMINGVGWLIIVLSVSKMTVKNVFKNTVGVCIQFKNSLTREKVGTSHKGLPVDQTKGVHIDLLQRRLTVPQIYRPLQYLWSHVADCPHLAYSTKTKAEVSDEVKLKMYRMLHSQILGNSFLWIYGFFVKTKNKINTFKTVLNKSVPEH